MKKGYTRRIYNLVFAICVLTTFYFSYQATRSYLRDYVYLQTEEMYNTYRQAHDEWRYELIKQGKQKEADEYGELSDQFVLSDFSIARHVSADPASQKIKWMRFRLYLASEHQTLISLFAPLAAYAALYFLVWHMAFLSVRYIKGDTSTESNSK